MHRNWLLQCNTTTAYVPYLSTDLYIWLKYLHCILSYNILLVFYVYDYDMFHIPLSYDSLWDLWNECMYVCMYVNFIPEQDMKVQREGEA